MDGGTGGGYYLIHFFLLVLVLSCPLFLFLSDYSMIAVVSVSAFIVFFVSAPII